MIRRPQRYTPLYSSAASDVYKSQSLKSLKSRETARVEIAMAVEIESDEGVVEITQGNEVAVVIGHHRGNARIQHEGSQTTARKPKLLKGVNAVIFQLGIPLFPMLLIRM